MSTSLRSHLTIVVAALLAACTSGSFTPRSDALVPPSTTAGQALESATLLDAAITRHSATLLGDGSVLVAGGLDVPAAGDDEFPSSPRPHRSAWRYVSSEVGLEALPDLTVARSGHTATRLLDGSVLIAGGFDASGTALDSTEFYDPDGGMFIGGPAMASARGDGTATLLADGRVLLVGGHEDSEHLRANTAIEIYDPRGQTFTTVADPGHHSGTNVAVSLTDGRVGIHWAASAEPPSLLFDPRTNRLTAPDPPLFGELPTPSVVSATRIQTGAVAVFDGLSFRLTDPSGRCLGNRRPCDGPCADVLEDDENCGACGNACPTGTACNAGSCTCDNGGTYCAGTCSDLSSDPSHCGSCVHACTGGQSCFAGECASDCGYETLCGAICVDTNYDALNCGGCGQSCGDGGYWSCTGTCFCPATLCGSACTNLQADPLHCGSCTNRCADGETCNKGSCSPPGCFLGCGGKCTSTYFDPKNCGACGFECSSGQVCLGTCQYCAAGTLACPTERPLDDGETLVVPACVNPKNDELHCGGCDTVCPSGVCVDGGCVPPCPTGQAMCAYPYYQTCQSLETDANCGACGRSCLIGQHCVGTTCTVASSEPTAPPLLPALATGTVWTTEASVAVGFNAYALASPEEVQTASITTTLFAEQEAFGGAGHTTTALPDGSLLTVGGSGTPRAARIYPPWIADFSDTPPQAVPDAIALTLADGRLLVATDGSLYQYRGRWLEPFSSVLPADAVALGAALQPSGSVLLLIHDARRALLFDPAVDKLTTLDVAFELASTIYGHAMPLPGGGILVAGREGVELASTAGTDKALEVRSLELELGCDQPALSRLPNGRVAVVGNDTLYEVDIGSGSVTASVELLFPRCRAAVVLRHDGGLLLAGGVDDASGTASGGAELYDPSARTTRRWSSAATGLTSGAAAHLWFDEALLVGGDRLPARVDWHAGAVIDANWDVPLSNLLEGMHLTAAGTWFSLDLGYYRQQLVHRGEFREVSFDFPKYPTLHMGEAVDFEATFSGHLFPGNAPEGSSGTTQSSPTNLPIPVWFPAEGGWPSLGTLTKTEGAATYRVPATPFPGLGLMFVATNGELTPLGPVTIAFSENGAECRDAGECESGLCVDGVCCDQACDGTCEACSQAKKGGGKDGECEPVAAGTPDDSCHDEIATCRENGTCDGQRKCALYPDGSECAPDAACKGGRCIGLPAPTPDDGNAGTAGSPSDVGTGATGGTRSDMPSTHNTCNADQQIVSPDGTPLFECAPYRCRNATCVARCESTRDCAAGYACDQGRCVTPVARRTEPIGCGCRVPHRSSSSSRDWGLLSLVTAVACLTRRTRRRPTRRPGA